LGRSAAENSSNRPADGLATVLGGVAAPVFRCWAEYNISPAAHKTVPRSAADGNVGLLSG